jgi:CheY-like chemotaxis protein
MLEIFPLDVPAGELACAFLRSCSSRFQRRRFQNKLPAGRSEYILKRVKLPLLGKSHVAAGRWEVFNSGQVLIASSDSLPYEKVGEVALRLGLQSVSCTSLSDARARIDEQPFQLVLCGDDLPDCNLRTAVRVLAKSTGGVPIIVLSHLAEWDAYMRALDAGAFDYIACPPDLIEAERILRLALAQNPPPRRASQAVA